MEHQVVAILHVLAADFLGIGEAVADDLEHQRIAGQGEHRHHHAGGAFGLDQLFAGVAVEMMEEGAEALGLALLGPAQHRVDFVDRLARQQRTQEYHRVADRGQIGMEIAARGAEQMRHVGAPGQHRLGLQLAAVVDQRDHAGREAVFAEHAANQVGATFAVEHRVQQFDAPHRILAPVRQIVLQADRDRGRAAGAVRVRDVERIVAQHPHEGVGGTQL